MINAAPFGFNTRLLNDSDLPERQEKLALNVVRLMMFESYSSQISSCPSDLASVHFLFTSFSPDMRCHWALLEGEEVDADQLENALFDRAANVASRDLNWICFFYHWAAGRLEQISNVYKDYIIRFIRFIFSSVLCCCLLCYLIWFCDRLLIN